MNKLLILFVGALMIACSQGSVPGGSSAGSYSEDLAYLRPGVPDIPDTLLSETKATSSGSEDYNNITPSHDVTAKLDGILNEIDALRSDVEYLDGYTVLVYSGTDSEKAHLAKGKVFTIIPEAKPELKYDEPNFRVKVGKYYTRLEAQKTFGQLKEKFPNAVIIPERIEIN